MFPLQMQDTTCAHGLLVCPFHSSPQRPGIDKPTNSNWAIRTPGKGIDSSVSGAGGRPDPRHTGFYCRVQTLTETVILVWLTIHANDLFQWIICTAVWRAAALRVDLQVRGSPQYDTIVPNL